MIMIRWREGRRKGGGVRMGDHFTSSIRWARNSSSFLGESAGAQKGPAIKMGLSYSALYSTLQ